MAVREKVLVVDDEPSIRKYLQTLLEVDGFEVETLSSGREAIKQISGGLRPGQEAGIRQVAGHRRGLGDLGDTERVLHVGAVHGEVAEAPRRPAPQR